MGWGDCFVVGYGWWMLVVVVVLPMLASCVWMHYGLVVGVFGSLVDGDGCGVYVEYLLSGVFWIMILFGWVCL